MENQGGESLGGYLKPGRIGLKSRENKKMTRVLSPQVSTQVLAGENNGILSTTGCQLEVFGTTDKHINISTKMEVSTPALDQGQIFPESYNWAHPEDDTANNQKSKLAIGVSRGPPIDIIDRGVSKMSFDISNDPMSRIALDISDGKGVAELIPHQESHSQVMPKKDEENVSDFVNELIKDTKVSYCQVSDEHCSSQAGFQFQDSDNRCRKTTDLDVTAMLKDIDEELDKPIPEENCSKFLSPFEKGNDAEKVFCLPQSPSADSTLPIQERLHTPMGIKVRGNNPNPEEDLRHYNITLAPSTNASFLDLLLLLKKQAKEKQVETPSSSFQEGQIVYGSTKACLDMLEKSEVLPSMGSHGVIIHEKLKPTLGRYTEQHYTVNKLLGKGAYGEVKLCIDNTTKTMFVRKQVKADFKKEEVEIMLNLKHQNITQLYGFIKREGTPEILMEYSGTSLLHFCMMPETCNLVTEELIWNINRQCLSALHHLAVYDIIHLDIKPENICIRETATGWTSKITDFGSAKLPKDQLTYQGWTAEYMSPEACISFVASRFPQLSTNVGNEWTVTSKSDVFAWGLTVAFMYRKTHLLMHTFTGGQNSYKNVSDPTQIKQLIIVSLANNPDMVKKWMIPDDCGQDMKFLLTKMLEGCPSQRISAEEAVEAIDKISSEKLLASVSQLSSNESITDDDCYIYNPETETQYTPRRRQRQYSSSTSICTQVSNSSILSHSSNTSLCSVEPGSPVAVPGRKARRRSVKKKLRERIEKPYPNRTENLEVITPDVALEGNVPVFALLG